MQPFPNFVVFIDTIHFKECKIMKKLLSVLIATAVIFSLTGAVFTAGAQTARFDLPGGTYELSGLLSDRSVESDFRAGHIGAGIPYGNEPMPSLEWLEIVRNADEINSIGAGETLNLFFDYDFKFYPELCEHICSFYLEYWSANPEMSPPCPHPGHEEIQFMEGSTGAKVQAHKDAVAECDGVHFAHYSIILHYNSADGSIPHVTWPFRVVWDVTYDANGTYGFNLSEWFSDSVPNLQYVENLDISVQITSTRGEGDAGKSIPATLTISNAYIEYASPDVPSDAETADTTAVTTADTTTTATDDGGNNLRIEIAVGLGLLAVLLLAGVILAVRKKRN
jgi:hypothetical protein